MAVFLLTETSLYKGRFVFSDYQFMGQNSIAAVSAELQSSVARFSSSNIVLMLSALLGRTHGRILDFSFSALPSVSQVNFR